MEAYKSLFWVFCAIWGLGTLTVLTGLIRLLSRLLEAFLEDSLSRQSAKVYAEENGVVSNDPLIPGIHRFDPAEKEYADGLRLERDKKARRIPYEGEV